MATQTQPALTSGWWPSKYGQEDEAGALNEITPGTALEAVPLVRHGFVVVDNLRLGEIARADVHEFLLVISHSNLRGATGMWVAPLAIV
jgi:hypothetical protein